MYRGFYLGAFEVGGELDSIYDLRLHVPDAEVCDVRGRIEATWRGRVVRVLHSGGNGRRKYPEFRGRFVRRSTPSRQK